ncbi:MAG: hypothetical protein H6597_08550 [Flavobacteriales bacterium]|nr:hypothetical protein [Flavobacteriales bacterium]
MDCAGHACAYNTAMAGNTGACTTTDNTVDYFLLTPSGHGDAHPNGL